MKSELLTRIMLSNEEDVLQDESIVYTLSDEVEGKRKKAFEMLQDLNEVARKSVPVDHSMILKYGFEDTTCQAIYGKVLAKHLMQVIKEFDDDAQGISGRKEFQTYVAIN